MNENPENWIDVSGLREEFPYYHFKAGVFLSPREDWRVRNLARIAHFPMECTNYKPSGPAIKVNERRHILSLIPGRIVTTAYYDSGKTYFEPDTRDNELKSAIERTFEAWALEFNQP